MNWEVLKKIVDILYSLTKLLTNIYLFFRFHKSSPLFFQLHLFRIFYLLSYNERMKVTQLELILIHSF